MSSGKVAMNTAALFARQAAILLINLYSIRILLSGLGIDDFALFSVIANIVALGSFLPGALGMITQRYFSFEIGKGEDGGLKRIHDASLVLCIGVTLVVVLALETAGVWFVANHLVVDPARSSAAHTLFQLTIFSFVAANLTGFYSSVIMAHEDMHVFALLSVLDALLRLGAVLSLGVLGGDKLIVYGFLLCGVSATILTAFWILCGRRYEECRPRWFRFEIGTLREMVGFAGWTLFGQVTTVSRNQAVTILINQAFNPATVAARALAASVSSQVLTFSGNFSAAIHPPIIKAHAAGEKKHMFDMIFTGSKITFLLVWVATLPTMAVLPGILKLWLGAYPPDTVLFVRLGLIENAVMAVSLPLMTAVRATGRMRLYETSLGSLQLLIFALSWLLVKAGQPAYFVYLVAITINVVMFAVRLAIVKHLTGLSVTDYLRAVLLPLLLVVAVSTLLVMGVLRLAPSASDLPIAAGPLGAAALICLLPLAVAYAIGLSGGEHRALNGMIRGRMAGLGSRA